MGQRIKFIIIGLGAILVISIFITLQIHISKLSLQKDRDRLKEENVSLTAKLQDGFKENESLKEQVNTLNSDLAKILKEKDHIEKQYETIAKERDELSALVKELELKVQAPKEKPPIPSDAYWAGILKQKADLELQLESLRSELKNMQINNEQLKSEKGVLELELKGITQEKQDTEQQLGYQQKMSETIASERVLETNTKRQLQDRLNSLKSENALLRRQLKSLSQYRATLERKLVKLQEEKSTFERRFNEMSLLLQERLSQLGDIKQNLDTIRSGGQIDLSHPQQQKESIELPPIVVRPQINKTSTQDEPFTEVYPVAKILAVNKENNFVIIDVGEDLGIKVGDTFQVYSGGMPIANIEVIRIRRNVSACDIKAETAPIQVGNTIR